MERKRMPAKEGTGKSYFQEKFGKKPAKGKKKPVGDSDASEERKMKRPGRGSSERTPEDRPGFKSGPNDYKGRSDKKFGERDFKNKPERKSGKSFEKGGSDRSRFPDKKYREKDAENRPAFGPKRQSEQRRFSDGKSGERDFDKKPDFKSKKPFERKPFPERDAIKKEKRQGIKKFFDEEQEQEKVYSGRGFANKKGKSFNPKADAQANEQRVATDSMPLNKYIAHCGICSRRDAVALIKDGKVKVNDAIITEPGFKLAANEKVELNGKKISIQKNLIYILLNKPKGYITTTDDPKGRRTVMDIFTGHLEERVFPVGRLDRNTTGLLLLTNDGELAQKLSHPKYKMRKIYQVTLDKNLAQADFDKIKKGLTLEDGQVEVDALEYLDEKSKLGIEIHSGKNRIVRRIFESLGYTVEKLDRVMYAGLTKKNVLRGKWRFLSSQEVINLKHIQ